MYGLDKSTEVNVIIEKSKLLYSLKSSQFIENNIEKYIDNITITNQIRAKSNKENIIKAISFISVKMINLRDSMIEDIKVDFLKYYATSIMAMFNGNKNTIILSILDYFDKPRIMYYKYFGEDQFAILHNNFKLKIDINNECFEDIYKQIVKIIHEENEIIDCDEIEDDYLIKNIKFILDKKDEYINDEYNKHESNSNHNLIDFIVENGVYPADDERIWPNV